MKRKQIFIWGSVVVAIVCILLIIVSRNSVNPIHYDTVDGIDTITICNVNDSNACITIMDRNLWATTNDITNRNSYGNHYQWWNNHWFSIGCWTFWCSDAITSSSKTNKLTRNNIYDNHWYDWWITSFIKWSSDYWDGYKHYNWLRWWADDNQSNGYWYDIKNNVAINVTWRQWPCPEWYHVPSIWERSKLLEYRASNYELKWNKLILNDEKGLKIFNSEIWNSQKTVADMAWLFQKDFKIPFAGFRYGGDAVMLAIDYDSYFLSSSPNGADAYYFVLDLEGMGASYYDERVSGLSLRCFKNFALKF